MKITPPAISLLASSAASRASASTNIERNLNMVNRAYKYSRGRGAIRVWLPTRVRHGRVEVGIRVQDEGIGMTPDQLSHLFERFYRADPGGAVPGTGLGMTLVKEILETLHGSVEVRSEFGRGTTVTLWLPVAGGGAQPESQVAPDGPAVTPGVVEADPAFG